MSRLRAIGVAAIIVSGILLVGCAETGDRALVEWRGLPVEAAEHRFGEPESVREAEAGRVYRWFIEDFYLVPGRRGPPTVGGTASGGPVHAPGRQDPPIRQRASCTIEMEVQDDGLISSYRATGSGCLGILSKTR